MLTGQFDGMVGLVGTHNLLREIPLGLTVAAVLVLVMGAIALDYARMLGLRSKMVQCIPNAVGMS